MICDSEHLFTGAATSEAFVKFRTERDSRPSMPELITPSLQVNLRAGEIPRDNSGAFMLKVPINGL